MPGMSNLRLLLALCLMGLPGCSSAGHSCTAMGCGNDVTLTFVSTDDTWAEGQYHLTLVVDSATYVCTAEPPDAALDIRRVECDAPLGTMTLAWRSVTDCVEHRSANSVSQTCTSVPDKFTLEAALQGTPKQVQVKLTRNDAPLLDQSVSLTYETTQPNGPDCEPVCKQAAVKIDVP